MDARAAEALKRGDLAGIEAVWAEYGPRLRRLCRSMTGDEQQADEAVAGVVLALYDEAIEAPLAPDPDTWVWTTAAAAAGRLVPRAPTPRHGDEAERADAVLATLPPEPRLALALCDVLGMAPERAAALTGRTPGRLRELLAEGRLAFAGPWEATRRGREPNR
jgi:DNA-directed RNA polymerase specialized sigma24 family protein